MDEVREFLVLEEEEGDRLDVYLSSQLGDMSRSYIQKIIKDKKVKVNDKVEKAKYLVKEEDKYLIYYTVGESEEEYTTEISNTASMETFTISNLINNTIYNLSYKKALTKRETPNSINFKYLAETESN